MAVPKKRTSSASRNQRRSHDGLATPQLVVVKNSKYPVPRRLKRAIERGLVTVKNN